MVTSEKLFNVLKQTIESKVLKFEKGCPDVEDPHTFVMLTQAMSKKPEKRLDEDMKLIMPLIQHSKLNNQPVMSGSVE